MTVAGETCRLAQNLARNCGYAVLPCHGDKSPACSHGFTDASSEPAAIARLWDRYPAPLVGIATGAVSGISVIDIDVKHDAALAWWRANEHRIPATRSYRTRSGGVHLYLLHAAGLGCSVGKLALGIDVRADGGYAVSWFAAGLACLDHSPPAAWPAWMLAQLMPQPKPEHQERRSGDRADKAIDGILDLVAGAAEGRRNSILH
jgi:hypothetical protein